MARVEGFEPASGLLAEAAEPSPEPPPRVDRGRPDQQWREVEALVQGVRETVPWPQQR
jgi:hypothetical protein